MHLQPGITVLFIKLWCDNLQQFSMCESKTWDALQAIKFYKSASIYKLYCCISFNLAPIVTTSLPQFQFWQAPDLNVTSKYFQQIGVKFVLEACKLSTVNWIISITYIRHVNTIGKPLEIFFFFFEFLIYFLLYIYFEFSDGFGTLPKFVLPALHFGYFECCVTYWMKYYSTREHILQKNSFSFLFAYLSFHTITAFFQSGSWMHKLLNN